MIRMYRYAVEQLVMLLVYLKSVDPTPEMISDVARRVRDDSNSPVGSALDHALDYPMPKIDEVLNELVAQIGQSYQVQSADATFIDQLVRILKLPFGRQYLMGGDVEALRKAILLPDEMIGLVDRLAQEELYCFGCHTPFRDSELVVYKKGSKDRTVFCMKCSTPAWVACSHEGCDCKVELTSVARKNLKNKTCGRSHDVGKEVNPTIPLTVGDRLNAEIQRINERMRDITFLENSTAQVVPAERTPAMSYQEYVGTRDTVGERLRQEAALHSLYNGSSPTIQAPQVQWTSELIPAHVRMTGTPNPFGMTSLVEPTPERQAMAAIASEEHEEVDEDE